MFEAQTYNAILARMLSRIPDNVDKREGSIIYDALAPAAAELSQMFNVLDNNNTLYFADTASGEYLARRTAEHGVNQRSATAAKRLGLFYASDNAPMDVPIGKRFSISGVTLATTKRLALGQFELTCETAGVVGNQYFGELLPVDYINGLSSAEISDVLVPGQELEPDESLRARFIAAINEKPFGGNVADYLQKVGSLPGVGGVKVFPAWQGGGTVKVTIIDSSFNNPTFGLINEVQTIIDPTLNTGEGIGYAPIGHKVTIAGVAIVTVNVSATLTLRPGFTISQVEDDIQAAIASYSKSLRESWASEKGLVYRIAQMESRILGVEGVADVTGTMLNGTASNIELGVEQIPVTGMVTLSE